MLIVSLALASGPGPKIEASPWGMLSKRSATGMCDAPKLKLATVEAVKPFMKVYRNLDGRVLASDPMSRATMRTLATLRGPDEAEFELVLEGGMHDGQWVDGHHNAPTPATGGLYLIGHADFQAGNQPVDWPDGTQLIISTIALDSSDADASELADTIRAFCSIREVQE